MESAFTDQEARNALCIPLDAGWSDISSRYLSLIVHLTMESHPEMDEMEVKSEYASVVLYGAIKTIAEEDHEMSLRLERYFLDKLSSMLTTIDAKK